mgnify:CR=1 FL=1
MSAETPAPATATGSDEDWGPFGQPLFDDPSARALSRVLPFKKSDATQARRSGDRFRRYVAISGEVNVKWERD